VPKHRRIIDSHLYFSGLKAVFFRKALSATRTLKAPASFVINEMPFCKTNDLIWVFQCLLRSVIRLKVVCFAGVADPVSILINPNGKPAVLRQNAVQPLFNQGLILLSRGAV
jgi:hypothetical protein